LFLIHEPSKLVHETDVFVGWELNLCFTAIALEVPHTLIKINSSIHVIRFKGKCSIYGFCSSGKLESRSICQYFPSFVIEIFRAESGTGKEHISRTTHTCWFQMKCPLQRGFILKEVDILSDAAHIQLVALRKEHQVGRVTICFWYFHLA